VPPKSPSLRRRSTTGATLCAWLLTCALAHAQEPAPAAEAAPAPPPTTPEAPPAEPGATPLAWRLDARAGLPVLKDGDTRLAGDLSAGVSGRTFGVELRGSVGTFDVAGAQGAFSQTDRAEGAFDGFVRLGSPSLAGEIRLSGGAAYYSTSINVPGAAFTDDDSTLGRGSVLVGVRGVSPSLDYQLLLGGGVQYESRGTLAAPTTANATIAIDDTEETKARFEGRGRLRVPFYRDNLAVRLIEDASMFHLTRDASAIRVNTGSTDPGVSQVSSTVSLRQIESRTRLALDLQLLAVGPLMPTVFVGLDVIAQSSDVGNTTAVIPLGGLGLVHPEAGKK
jgi:hypothetical protein